MPCDTSYLFECGVLHRLLLLRSFHNLLMGKRNNLTLSLFYIDSAMGLGGYKDLDMNEKGMLQICLPFIMAVVVIALFYGLYLVLACIYFLFDIFNIDLYFLEDIALFLDIFSGYHSGGIIIAIILWLII